MPYHLHTVREMRPNATDITRSVVCVCALDTRIICEKKAESIKMPFGADSYIILHYKNKNWLQFLFFVKAAALKQQIYQNFIHIFNAHKLTITFISLSGLS